MKRQTFTAFATAWLKRNAGSFQYRPLCLKITRTRIEFRFDGLTQGLIFAGVTGRRSSDAEIVGHYRLADRYFWDIVFEVAAWRGYFSPANYHCVSCDRRFPAGCRSTRIWRHLLLHLRDFINAITDESRFGIEAKEADCGAVHCINLKSGNVVLSVVNMPLTSPGEWPDRYLLLVPIVQRPQGQITSGGEWLWLPWWREQVDEIASRIARQFSITGEVEAVDSLSSLPNQVPGAVQLSLVDLVPDLPEAWRQGEFMLTGGHEVTLRRQAEKPASYRLVNGLEGLSRYAAICGTPDAPVVPDEALQRIANLMHYSRGVLFHLYYHRWYRSIPDNGDLIRYLLAHADGKPPVAVRFNDGS